MNLYQTAKYILSVAQHQPNVGLTYEGDIYDLNEKQDIAWPAVAVSQVTHAESGEWRGYGFNIFYVDRLTADKGNRLEIQSIAIEALSNIAKVLVESGFETQGEIRFHTFDERFDAECAGAYMEIILQSEESLCADGMMPYIPGGTENPSWFNPDDYYTSAQTDDRIAKAIEEAELSGITLDDYWTSAQTQTAINDAVSGISVSGVTEEELANAIAAETARTEQTYLKQGALNDYYTSAQTDTAIQNAVSAITVSGVTRQELDNAIAAETARTEQTYVKQENLSDYYTSAQTNSAITNAINTESARTDIAISNAIAAETARTEQTYLKEHQSLADYWTSAQTQSAITEATSGISVPIATQNTLGVVKVGSGLNIDSGGTLSATGGGGGDYIVTDALSSITNPVEGMIAYVPAHYGSTGNKVIFSIKQEYRGDDQNFSWKNICVYDYKNEEKYLNMYEGQYYANTPEDSWFRVIYNDLSSERYKAGTWAPLDPEGIIWARLSTGGTDLEVIADSGITNITWTTDFDERVVVTTGLTAAIPVAAKTYIYLGGQWLVKDIRACFMKTEEYMPSLLYICNNIEKSSVFTGGYLNNVLPLFTYDFLEKVYTFQATKTPGDAAENYEFRIWQENNIWKVYLGRQYRNIPSFADVTAAVTSAGTVVWVDYYAFIQALEAKSNQSGSWYLTSLPISIRDENDTDIGIGCATVSWAKFLNDPNYQIAKRFGFTASFDGVEYEYVIDVTYNPDTWTVVSVNKTVSSNTITQIWTGSQQAYDAMTGHSANVLYIINS